MDNICRTCVKETTELVPMTTIIVSVGSKHELKDMYMEFTGMNFLEETNLPTNMCTICVNKLTTGFFYKRQCFSAIDLLKNQLAKFSFVDVKETDQINESECISNDSFLLDSVSNSGLDEHIETVDAEAIMPETIDTLLKDETNESVDDTNIAEVMPLIESDTKGNVKEKLMVIPKSKPRKIYHPRDSSTVPESTDNPNNRAIMDSVSATLANIKTIKKSNSSRLCSVCGELITGSHKYHMLKHESYDMGNYECEHCKASFANRVKLKNHVLHHHTPKRHFCDVCGKGFIAPSALKYHYLNHTGAYPYECKTCGKKSRSKSDHVIHVRFHTGERPFKCQYCEKTFASQSARKEHESVHVSDKIYECKLCTESFDNARSFKIHKNRHLTHNCLICDKSFKCAKYVLSHMRTHPEYKPIECGSCGKKFREEKYLEIHTRTCHNKYLVTSIDMEPKFIGDM